MFIRPAELNDTEACTKVIVKAMSASSDYNCPDPKEIFDHWFSRVGGYLSGTYHPGFALEDRVMFVAEEGGKIIACIAGQKTLRFACDGELQWAFVLPEYQRRGIGKSLLSSLRNWFGTRKLKKICCNAPQDMSTRAFYIKFGATPMNEHWVIWEDITKQ